MSHNGLPLLRRQSGCRCSRSTHGGGACRYAPLHGRRGARPRRVRCRFWRWSCTDLLCRLAQAQAVNRHRVLELNEVDVLVLRRIQCRDELSLIAEPRAGLLDRHPRRQHRLHLCELIRVLRDLGGDRVGLEGGRWSRGRAGACRRTGAGTAGRARGRRCGGRCRFLRRAVRSAVRRAARLRRRALTRVARLAARRSVSRRHGCLWGRSSRRSALSPSAP